MNLINGTHYKYKRKKHAFMNYDILRIHNNFSCDIIITLIKFHHLCKIRKYQISLITGNIKSVLYSLYSESNEKTMTFFFLIIKLGKDQLIYETTTNQNSQSHDCKVQ